MFYYMIGFIAVSCYASLTVLNKMMQKNIPPFTYIAITMLLLSVFSAVIAVLYEKSVNLSEIIQQHGLLLIGFSIINLIGFALLLFAITKISVFEYQLIGLLTPLIGGIFAYLILQETITIKHMFGFLIAACGCYIALKK